MQPDVHNMIDAAWIAVGILWLITSLIRKPTARTQSLGSRLVQTIIVALGVILLFNKNLRIGPLAARLVPASAAASYTGLLLTVAGICIAVWARFFLGRNWSSVVTVKQDHELVRSGPYAIVRHPIYSGFLLALLGTAIEKGHLAGFVGVALALIGWRMKSLVEEKFMIEQFGAEYVQYKHDVKALIPLVW